MTETPTKQEQRNQGDQQINSTNKLYKHWKFTLVNHDIYRENSDERTTRSLRTYRIETRVSRSF